MVYSEGEEVVANVEVVSRWVAKTVLGVTTNCSRVGWVLVVLVVVVVVVTLVLLNLVGH